MQQEHFTYSSKVGFIKQLCYEREKCVEYVALSLSHVKGRLQSSFNMLGYIHLTVALDGTAGEATI